MDNDLAMPERKNINAALLKTIHAFMGVVPIIIGMILLTGLITRFIPMQKLASMFGNNAFLDALTGAFMGSISAGHPLTSYVLGGELLAGGVSLIAVTAFIISWVTVGSIQLPAEALMLGKRFAIYRNLLSFIFAILISVLTVTTLRILG